MVLPRNAIVGRLSSIAWRWIFCLAMIAGLSFIAFVQHVSHFAQSSNSKFEASTDLNNRKIPTENVQPVVLSTPDSKILPNVAGQHLTRKLELRSYEFARSNREDQFLQEECNALIAAGADVTERSHIYLDDLSEEDGVAWISSHSADQDQCKMLNLAIEFSAERWLCAQLRTGYSPNLRDPCGVPVICFATRNPRLLTRLLAAGADPRAIVDLQCTLNGPSFWCDRSTTLHFAAYFGNTESIQLLLRKGIEVNSFDSLRRTPVFSAVQSLRADAIVELIDAGADLQARDFRGNTPLEYLLNCGYDPTDTDFQSVQAALASK